jgi:hypothetical protein
MHNTLLKQIILPFWAICTLQKGPQALPVSGLLLLLTVIFSLIIDMANLYIVVVDPELLTLLTMAGLYSLGLASSLSFLMWLMRYRQRILQTLSALFGTGIIISLCALPFLLMLKTTPDEPSIFSIFILGINIWSLVVTAHILRHALSVSLLMAWVLAFGYFLLGFKITDFFIPQGI